MKKLSKVVLVGALALGGFAGLGAFNANPAAAAEKSAPVQAALPYDEWGITDTWILNTQIENMPTNYKAKISSSYKTGQTFTVILDWTSHLSEKDQVKIFRIDEKGELSRFKTINWENVYDYQEQKQKALWQTQITDNYQAGTYVAVSYIDGKHYKSDLFTINK